MIGLGLMSGTSVDAIDAAVVRVSEEPLEMAPSTPHDAGERTHPGIALAVELLHYREAPIDEGLRRRIHRLFQPETSQVDDLCELNVLLGEAFARAAEQALERSRASVDFVASHGQTVWHETRAGRTRGTLQIGEPSVIAERLGVTVVADFRPRDIAAGGQGAPLTSYVDVLLVRGERPRAVQNIGGIGNVTWVPPEGSAAEPLAFDTGPGNVLIDHAVGRLTDGRRRCDVDGALAAAGTVDEALLAELLDHPYFAERPPKTTGREVFGASLADEIVERGAERGLRPEDIVATLTAFTAASIADQHRRFLPEPSEEVVLAGGGALNPALVSMLETLLAPARIRRHEELGLPAAAREAVCFAVLGYQTLHDRPNTIAACTGARHPVVLGAIVPGLNHRELTARVSRASRGDVVRLKIVPAQH
jgi:anhydro-N-acetylmuramic acid kinase